MKRKEQGGKDGTGRGYLQILTFSFDLHIDSTSELPHSIYTQSCPHTNKEI